MFSLGSLDSYLSHGPYQSCLVSLHEAFMLCDTPLPSYIAVHGIKTPHYLFIHVKNDGGTGKKLLLLLLESKSPQRELFVFRNDPLILIFLANIRDPSVLLHFWQTDTSLYYYYLICSHSTLTFYLKISY